MHENGGPNLHGKKRFPKTDRRTLSPRTDRQTDRRIGLFFFVLYFTGFTIWYIYTENDAAPFGMRARGSFNDLEKTFAINFTGRATGVTMSTITHGITTPQLL